MWLTGPISRPEAGDTASQFHSPVRRDLGLGRQDRLHSGELVKYAASFAPKRSTFYRVSRLRGWDDVAAQSRRA